MSTTMRLTDDAIRLALTPAPDVHAPTGLADQVRSAVAVVPQRRRSILGWSPSRRARLVLWLAIVGLFVLAVGGLLLLAGSRPPALPPSISTYHGGPERNGVMPGPGPTGPLRVEWETQVNGSIGTWSPAVVNGTVYVADESGEVTALSETTGRTIWSKNVGATINSGLTVAAGLIIVGDDIGVVHALPVDGGAERWHFSANSAVHSAAAVLDGVAYVGSTDGHLYAIDMEAGTSRWQRTVMTAGPIGRALAASVGRIFVGSGGATPNDGGTLQAYDATGSLTWSQRMEPGNTSTPSIADGRVFVSGGLDGTATGAHDLYAFDEATGNPVWPNPFRAPSGKTLLIGAVAGGLVFALGTDGTMDVLDAATGVVRWTVAIGSTQSPSAGVVGGAIYVTSDDRRIHAFDIATETELWPPFAIDGVPGSPAIVDGRIIVGTSFGEVISVIGGGDPPGPGGSGSSR
jgi:outer membrane protein assembly factor BamB